ncbi:MAG TPA: ABC transporter permease [Gaiellaceae bacterium]|nr:ABC transporter permease [Gaiellaceae bacterium]
MTTYLLERLVTPRPHPGLSLRVVERNFMVYRRTWMVIVSGFFEPLFYLFSLGIGLDTYIGDLSGPGGEQISYAAFVAPALLAASAMNGAFYDATNVFWKLRYEKVYDAMLATPVAPRDVAVGETTWALVRCLLYAGAFFVVIGAMGLVGSWWAVLVLPAAALIGLAFAGIGIAAMTFMRSWQDFDLIQLVMLPMFLFSATFYPLSVYPASVRWIVQATPLYHASTLMRSLTTGTVSWDQAGDVAYLVLLGLVGVAIASRRIRGALVK